MDKSEMIREFAPKPTETSVSKLARSRFNRRALLGMGGCWMSGWGTTFAHSGHAELISSIEKQVLEAPPVENGTWFHPRACLTPDRVLMTVQAIQGSDFFGPVHWTESVDLGKSWSEFRPVPPLGWEKFEGQGFEGVCDVTPETHEMTGSVLALGHNVYYRGKVFDRNQPPRWPIYAVWKDGRWGPRHKLQWDDPRGSYIYSNNCGQRVVKPNGDIAMSFTFGVKDKPRAVCGVLCGFDGDQLRVKATGNALLNGIGRGLLEPSVTFFDSRYWMTIRAEDGRGYLSVGDDGLTYAEPLAWQWDDGESLEMSTTQQHWVNHSSSLFLVYTRKDKSNVSVPRWRAPLWISQLDHKSMRLIRSTEQVLLPLTGDGVLDGGKVPMMGNFGVANVSPHETWITDGSWCPKTNHSGELQIARIRWTEPNRNVSNRNGR
jgi:hypothetical protein